MKKKYLILTICFIFLTGCTNIKLSDYDNLINEELKSTVKPQNEYRAGYVYYLPKGLRIIENTGSNEVFKSENANYYLYVDRISYYNKVNINYTEKDNVYYSKRLTNDDKFGYVEIKNAENDQYFIEIMYNYAKIEVIVPKEKINEALVQASTILTSIKYQDTVLKSLIEESILKANEVEYNIFETAKTESGYLEIAEEYGKYQEEKETVDPDFIRR